MYQKCKPNSEPPPADLSYSLLNEDVLGTDEIFAELMLTGWRPFNSKERATTGIVEYEFG
ncbi:hypothetical protein KFU94_32005 [Chloroflexi bacterium TSY]|nr:hypothetical protein [Chloroflexi bacterium TSY]